MNIGLYDKGKYKFKCPVCEMACNGHVKTENSRRVIMVTKDMEETAELGTSGRRDTVGTDDEIACPACGEVCSLTGVVVMGGSLRCAGCGYVGEAEFEVRIRWHGPEMAESTEPAPCPRCGAAHTDYDEDDERHWYACGTSIKATDATDIDQTYECQDVEMERLKDRIRELEYQVEQVRGKTWR